jgi:hypothetical protein
MCVGIGYDVTEYDDDDDEQCYQLLSLLYLFGSSSSTRLKYLCRKETITNLLALLGTNTAPRSQRLVLRFLRRLLPYQQDNINNLVELFLDEIGKLMFQHKYFEETQKPELPPPQTTTTTTTTTTKEAGGTSATQESKEKIPEQISKMEVESSSTAAPTMTEEKKTQVSTEKQDEKLEIDNLSEHDDTGEDDSGSDMTKKREYALYLNYWPSTYQRLVEVVLLMHFQQTFMISSQNLMSISGLFERLQRRSQ